MGKLAYANGRESIFAQAGLKNPNALWANSFFLSQENDILQTFWFQVYAL